ncbi:interleukin 12 receptor, beta 2a, like [Pseudochaenichthys georgianus]|uniref:interleukin 12 receptor, beta 2a, like n=1 Tax=Pseudochaenichthys georgianus TaxID=52239 RepID=UPI00146F519F|nr:interleukin 12 receptor, beta 2a, like [Pseudochaenichthys georgianus]
MATLWTRWLLSMLLANLLNCLAQGPPVAPSPPECSIPCGEKNNCVDIHCNPGLDPRNSTEYSLHWEPADSEERQRISGNTSDWIIRRVQFKRGKLCVWVQAKNQYGSAKSPYSILNTEHILKLPPPKVASHQESFNIYWNFTCDDMDDTCGLFLRRCDVRYRTEAEQDWHEDEDEDDLSYTMDDPQPSTVYEFQVRCSCGKCLKSDWSAIHRLRSTETAPVGVLDLWQDCDITQQGSDCALTWKKLPPTCGLILGYEARLSYNSTLVLLNVSTAEPKGLLVCEEIQCHLTSSLKDVSSVSVSAYNAQGATVPSYLTLPIPGKEKTDQAIHVEMNEENLTVSWDSPSQPSDNLKEHVVQYKQVGCLSGQGFDWVKATTNQTTALFKGQYKKYTPYQVSLFTISHGSEVHHISSVIRYSLEGSPSAVPSFKVFSIADTQVTLFWESVPLSKQSGVILYYQIVVYSGVHRQTVHNASASPQHENTYKLEHLNPEQNYEVRIRAVTAAGPGANATAKFKTKHREDYAHRILPIVLVVLSVVVICFVIALCRKNKACLPSFYYKVPDARNSHIFKNMHMISDSLGWICIPLFEPHPKISLLEVVEIRSRVFKSSLEKASDPEGLTTPVIGDECSQMDSQDDKREEAVPEECHRADHRYGREEYSKMVDSEEERDKKEENGGDCLSSSEEDQSMSGYEKHFMPTVFELRV